MSFPDWGSVPAWLGAVSILIAFRIFVRDRRNADRTQADRVGTWFEVDRELVFPPQPRIDTVKIRINIRNGTDLPIEATQTTWTIDTKWGIPSKPINDPNGPTSWRIIPGHKDPHKFTDPIMVAPQSTWIGDWQEFNLSHTAPDSAKFLDPLSQGVRPRLVYQLITDNAGRRWHTRHTRGRPAKRIRWYSRSAPHYPVHWQNRLGRLIRRERIRVSTRMSRVAGRNFPSRLPQIRT
jgi:hypothetical protein